jgi:signal transduction histidine kinase
MTVAASRWPIVAVTLVALAALGWACLSATTQTPDLGLRAAPQAGELIVSEVMPAGTAWDAGIHPQDRVIAVDNAPLDPAALPTAVQHATSVTVRAPDGRTRTVARGPIPGRAPSFLPLAFCFTAVGAVVYLLAIDRRAATALFGMAIAAAAALIAAIATPIGMMWALALEFVAAVAFGATVFLLSLVFPRDYLRERTGRWAALLCAVASLMLLAAYVAILAGDGAGYAVLRPVLFVILAVEMLTACVLVTRACVGASAREQEARRALTIVALGTATGIAPFCLLVLVPTAVSGRALVRPDWAILALAFLPASIGAAVLRRQLLGIDRVVRRSIVALLVWAVLTGGYIISFALVVAALGGRTALPALAPAIAITAATYPLAERRVRRACERLLFHDVYDYSGTLRTLAHELVQLRSIDEVASHALMRLGQTLDLAWAAIHLSLEGLTPTQFTWGDVPIDLAARLQADLGATAMRATPVRIADAVALVVPLASEGAAGGSLAIGPKRRDLELSPEDQTLIATLVPLLATIFQNVLLVERLSQQVAMLGERDRTMTALSARLMQVQEEERHRLALDLHDDPLQRAIFLAREVGADTHPLAHQWRAALDDIIAALRAICVGLRPPALDDFGLPAGLERLVRNLQAQTDLPVTLRRERSIDAPLRLAPDLEVALYRVAQEAVNNALKHADARCIDLAIAQTEEWVRLTVADDGHGLYAASGNGQGLALGILGMRERLRPWGGCITIANRETGGTLVTAEVRLHGKGLNHA